MANAVTRTIASHITPAIVIALLLALPCSPVFAWTPVPCSPTANAARAAFREHVRAAKPGQPLYVAHPTPASDQNVVLDFISQFPATQSPDLSVVAAGIGSGDLRLEVKPVEDWTSDRCGKDRGDSFWLITVRDCRGAEVARGAVLESGLVANVGLLKNAPRDVAALPSLNDAVAKLAAHGVRARDPQYVATAGSIRCRMLNPCVAMRNERGIYILSGGAFFLLPIGTPIYAVTPPREPYVSIGTNAFVIAQRLP